ncbi:MAG: hypothetical protein ACOC3V_03530 [bacterium]
MKFAIIADRNSYGEPTTYQVISYTHPATSKKHMIVEKSYLFKQLQRGEIEFAKGTYLPEYNLITNDYREIISWIFKEF